MMEAKPCPICKHPHSHYYNASRNRMCANPCCSFTCEGDREFWDALPREDDRRDDDAEKTITDIGSCADCGRRVEQVAGKWRHVGHTPRHMARPRKMGRKRTNVPKNGCATCAHNQRSEVQCATCNDFANWKKIVPTCSYCGDAGHWRPECEKLKELKGEVL